MYICENKTRGIYQAYVYAMRVNKCSTYYEKQKEFSYIMICRFKNAFEMVAIMIMKTLREQGKFLWFTYANIQKMLIYIQPPGGRTSHTSRTSRTYRISRTACISRNSRNSRTSRCWRGWRWSWWLCTLDFDYERHDNDVRTADRLENRK